MLQVYLMEWPFCLLSRWWCFYCQLQAVVVVLFFNHFFVPRRSLSLHMALRQHLWCAHASAVHLGSDNVTTVGTHSSASLFFVTGVMRTQSVCARVNARLSIWNDVLGPRTTKQEPSLRWERIVVSFLQWRSILLAQTHTHSHRREEFKLGGVVVALLPMRGTPRVQAEVLCISQVEHDAAMWIRLSASLKGQQWSASTPPPGRPKGGGGVDISLHVTVQEYWTRKGLSWHSS